MRKFSVCTCYISICIHADINQMAANGSGRMSYGSFSFEYGVNLRLQKQSTGQGSSSTKKEVFALQKDLLHRINRVKNILQQEVKGQSLVHREWQTQ